MKRVIAVFLLFALLFATSCGDNSDNNTNQSSAQVEYKTINVALLRASELRNYFNISETSQYIGSGLTYYSGGAFLQGKRYSFTVTISPLYTNYLYINCELKYREMRYVENEVFKTIRLDDTGRATYSYEDVTLTSGQFSPNHSFQGSSGQIKIPISN